MTIPRSLYVPIAGHEIHVADWGAPSAPVVVLWHGLTRTGRDFDTLATHLSSRWRVICPDTIGRGFSTWAKDPDREYTVSTYAEHATALLDALEVTRCHWIGTSMGALIGMAAAAGPLKERIDRLVLNDIGPVLNPVAVNRIKSYVTYNPDFATITEFEAFLRFLYAGFGPLSDAEWRHMAETSMRRCGNGRLTNHYDPKIMTVFGDQVDESFSMWPEYDAITCPTLLLRGAQSDLLMAETAEEMTCRGPKARLITIAGCGHAPYLNTPEQIAEVDEFLG